jgi:ethanolamine ammonia-lyase small subunit
MDKKLEDIIRDAVLAELAEPRSLTPEPPTAEERQPTPEALRGPALPPDELLLAKKVANWIGAEFPTMPWAGKWRPAGNRDYYLSKTPARLAVGRVGTRYRTETVLNFIADHAAARDAVHSDLDGEMLGKLGFTALQSAAPDKKEFLARPDLGRRLSEDSQNLVRQHGARSPQVQVVAADGLSAAAINVNLPLVYPALATELQGAGVKLGTPFGISNSRVACGDEVARALDADVLVLLVGERPGLKTAESMGAYVTYMKVKDFNEAMRSVISNIHSGGLKPTEGAHEIAKLALRALRDKRTGVEMSL